jgi:3-oxoacyl-[acyl-carrier protein] reductase
MRLKGRVSLVTGASRGIGKAIALTFAREGSEVIVVYVQSKDKAEAVVAEIEKMGRKAIAVRCDVANRDEVFAMVDEGLKTFGRIDILVNNAATTRRFPNPLDATKEAWDRVLGVNLLGTYFCIQATAPGMIRQRYGKIVNFSSAAGIADTMKTQVIYAPSKAAVINLTRKLAYELGEHNINVNAVAPGLTKTEMLFMGRSEEEARAIQKKREEMAALKRLGEPQDIANVALFLASDESSYVTGQVILADGGATDYLSHGI